MPKLTPSEVEIATASLNALAEHVWCCAEEKGFKEKPVPMSELCSNLHGEVSELWESHRRQTLDQQCDKQTPEPLTCAEEELADIIIRALDTAREKQINIARAVRVKDAYNQGRAWKHGGKIA